MKVLVYNHHYDPATLTLRLSQNHSISPVSPRVMEFPSPEGIPYITALLQRYEGKIVDPDTIISAIESIRLLMRVMREVPRTQILSEPASPLTTKAC